VPIGPDFLVVGAARSGTTALYQYLSQHPRVFLTEPKEPHYFALAGTTPDFTGPGDRQTINRLAVTDPGRYRELFRPARPGQVRGEASVSTLYYPRAVDRVREEVPAARLVCLLRNPADRAFSAYSFMRTRGWEPCARFEDALDDESRRIDAGWHHIWHYTAMGRYGEQLRHVLRVFPRDQVLVLRYDDLVSDADALLAQVYGFLDLPAIRHDVTPDPHRSGEPRVKLLSRIVSTHHPVKKVLSPVVPAALRQRLRRAIVRRNVVRGSYSDATRRRLQASFQADLDVLAELTGLDVSPWQRPAGAG